MPPISRGFGSRRREVDPSRIPPGQYVVSDFPVLTAGPTPRVRLDDWSFTIDGAIDAPLSWSWVERVLRRRRRLSSIAMARTSHSFIATRN